MIDYKINKEDINYLDIEGKWCLQNIIQIKNVPLEIKTEAQKLYDELLKFECQNKMGYVRFITIKCDSLLGTFLINRSDVFIDYENIYNAFMIAVYEENSIASKVLPLFKKKIFGYKKDLEENFGSEVVNYILMNNNFKSFISEDIYHAKEYVVYENDGFELKKLNNREINGIKK